LKQRHSLQKDAAAILATLLRNFAKNTRIERESLEAEIAELSKGTKPVLKRY
jgi:hypothetical protein